MADWVRLRLPWNWEGLDDEDLHQRLRDLAAWVSWFVARYHLAGRVPVCWYRHPGLTDELSALWHYHQEVTNPLVPLVQSDPVGAPEEPEDREVAARSYQDWHEARWRWITGPLAEALGYSECRSKGHHVDDGHAGDAAAVAEATTTGLQEAIDAGDLKR
jgi:hypothetical protein